MSLDGLEILEGEDVKRRLSSEDLRRFVVLWVHETFVPMEKAVSPRLQKFLDFVGELPQGGKVLSLVKATRDKVSERFPGLSSQKNSNDYQRFTYIEQYSSYLEEMIANGDVVVACRDGRPVSMVRVTKLSGAVKSDLYSGELYEIGKALTVPEERGKGIYRRVRQQAIDHLRTKYGDVAILTGTKNEGVKKLNREDGWREIGFDNYLKLHGAPPDYIAKQRAENAKEGWTAFLYVPEVGRSD
ncbi:hypothetical protein CVV38_02450 [Candidatus Peregrinibacteria bacterium HGW-Peregrinibacteria-1]|jgi:predicted GNAT family N-acyltransferase|nr:MAG: hypothetical protein CVV38_02450 [Candidatus Peregrinibacteria bacterium HGW-Peregrinibacteria-1]